MQRCERNCDVLSWWKENSVILPALCPGVDFLAFPPINIGERYKKIFDLRKVISQSEIPFDLKQLHQLSVGL